ncbi:short-chain dehydrogenase/reductase SDR [Planococcus antarcticus DSM 14505]|uniref:Short-chain dehydrogenase n=1 Tax=Planococcus antarcticus DSM 14505 TaxID=1185653 RepID=A0A1C7DH28_9BACL|nr:SDR family NAD(P)-dependent oxidoreductase [Planococcus antarcticus]ANU10712.1 short-chain dehydrogenase [Planococcus antarcticus DSM 14505]EIM06800.1 short-chain dehydrogenase/reductase SDR [Planococcus antarcticus DSM 14505]
MAKEAYIITGASKGIGFEWSRQLSEAGHLVIGIARTEAKNWPGAHFLSFDLTCLEAVEEIIAQALKLIPKETETMVLVNNAGTIEPIGLAHKNDAAQVSQSIVLNLTAPMLLCSAFIRQLEYSSAEKKIVNISSGAGRKVYEGWSAYCTGKAGLDHFSSCLDVEYEGVKVVSVAPGIIDTGMQKKIRQSDAADFPLIEKFLDYKESGLLSSPEETAKWLMEMTQRPDFKELPTILDIRNLPQARKGGLK